MSARAPGSGRPRRRPGGGCRAWEAGCGPPGPSRHCCGGAARPRPGGVGQLLGGRPEAAEPPSARAPAAEDASAVWGDVHGGPAPRPILITFKSTSPRRNPGPRRLSGPGLGVAVAERTPERPRGWRPVRRGPGANSRRGSRVVCGNERIICKILNALLLQMFNNKQDVAPRSLPDRFFSSFCFLFSPPSLLSKTHSAVKSWASKEWVCLH